MSAIVTDGAVRPRVLVADEEPLVREALARLVGELQGAPEVLEADSVAAARQIIDSGPDLALVILDIALSDADGVAAIARLRQGRPDQAILVLSAHDDPATARAALDAGARGFISKRSPTRVLAEAVRLVLIGGMYVPPQALRAPPPLGSDWTEPEGPTTPGSFKQLALTPRQRDVLALLIQGKPNKAICRELQLAEGTVKTHTAAIYRALGVTNRTQAVYAMNRRKLELPPPRRAEAAPPPVPKRESHPAARRPGRVHAATETLRTVANRFRAAEGSGRWSAMLGLQPA